MTTAIAETQAVTDFEKFAKLGQRSPKLEKRIVPFLAQLVEAATHEQVKQLCEKELSWLRDPEGGNYSARSMPNRASKYRTAIQACFEERGTNTRRKKFVTRSYTENPRNACQFRI